MESKRVVGVDSVRFFAILFVLSVHFFGFIPFHGTPMDNCNMALQLFLRQLFFLCIPLFLILTGYLQSKKEYSVEYYKGLKYVIPIYVFYSILSILFRVYYQKETFDVLKGVFSILNYTANPRAWYVNMYIGLFLITPFLNVLYNNLKSHKEKVLLILTLCSLTAIPGFVNGLSVISLYTNTILPDWWIGVYPLTYFFIGAYIREYKPKTNKVYNAIGLVMVLVLQCCIFYFESKGGNLEYTFKVSYNGTLLSLVSATLFFTLFYDLDIMNKPIRYFITDASKLSFEIYLASFLTDYTIYPYVTNCYYKSEQQFLKYYLLIVPLSFLISYLIAYTRRFLYSYLIRHIRAMREVRVIES